MSHDSYKGTNPIHEGPTLMPHLILITSQRPCLLISLHWGAGFQFMNWGGGWLHSGCNNTFEK